MRVWTGWGSRLFLHLIFVLTIVFIWEAAAGNRRKDSAQGDADTLSNQELHRLLSLFNTTPKPSTTSPATSFVPTEVIPPQQLLQQKLQQLQQVIKIQRQQQAQQQQQQQQQQQPKPPKIVRRKELQKSVNRNGDAASANLLQQLSVLSSFLEASGVQAQQGTSPATESTTTTVAAPPSNAAPLPVDDQASALQSLALLSALLGGAGNTGNNAANLATLLGVEAPAPSSPVTRQAEPQTTNNNDPTAAALTNLLLAQAGLSPQQLPQTQTGDQQQDFQKFANSQANLDPAATNQLSGLLGLLGTLGTLGNLAGGGSQAPSLFNFGQQQQQPNILQSLMGAQQKRQPSSTDAFANLFGGSAQQQQQNNLLANLLGGQQGSSNSLFSQPQQQPPGVLASLGNLGSSLFSVAGNTLGGLSGTRGDGKPRVRGVDTRLGLGYRLGQNADAQVMMEIGPQLFTEAIPGEHRPGVPPNGVASNSLRDVRQPSTELVQQLLEQELEKQKDIQRRHQIQQLTKEELEHQRIGQLLHVKPYYNPPNQNQAPNPPFQRRQQPPHRYRQMFPYPPPHQHQPQQRFQPPMNPYYRNMPPPPTVLQSRTHNHNQWKNNVPRNNYPLNYNVHQHHAGPWNNNQNQAYAHSNNPKPFNSMERQTRPTPTAASRPVSKPKPTASSESEPNSMLTEYEKWLVKRGASSQGLGPSSSLSKRMLPFNDENSELSRGSLAMAENVPKTIPKTQFSFHSAREPSSVNLETKIVRMSQKRPATLKSEAFASRVGNLRPSPNFRRPNPNPSVMPPFRHPQSGLRNFGYPMLPPPARRNVNANIGRWQTPPHVRRYHRIPNGPGGYQRQEVRRSDPQPTQTPVEHNYNPFQNFVMEADDSFLRRNAQTHIQNEKMEDSGQRPGVTVTVNVSPKLATNSAAPVPASKSKGVPALDAAVKAGSTAFNVFKEVIKPAVKYFRPSVDSLHPFSNLQDNEDGDYTPTKEPILIATPTPTPIPSLYDHMGKKNPNLPDQTPEEQASAVVHVGEGLTYGDLASSLRISPKGKKRKKKPGKDSDEDNDEAESRVEGPVNAPGVEMFIDIESGELSVRKPIASLTHFGEVTTTTTLKPEPKTEDEIEDEESGKIFESLQEHFKSEYDNFQVTQAALQAAKERKEKIKKEQDESLGLVNRYFDLLNDGDEGTDTNRRRKRVDSVRISEHRN